MKSKYVLQLLFAAFLCTRVTAQLVIPAISFGNNGTFQHTISAEEVAAGNPIVQPDSKLLIAVSAGDEEGYSTSKYIYRITRDGQLDKSFAHNGILQTGLLAGIPHSITRGNSFDLQPDGKIVVVTILLDRTNDLLRKLAIERYMPDGKPDSSFGTNGVNVFPESYPNFITSVRLTLKPSGKILIAIQTVNSGVYSNSIAQFNSNGHVARNFGDSGILQLTSPYEQYSIQQLQVLSNNQFVITANFNNDGMYGTCEIFHNADGSIDSAKGTNGVVINGYSEEALANTALQHNKLLVYTSIQMGDSLAAVLLRYNADGTLDNSFGNNGMVKAFLYKPAYNALQPVVKVQDNGKIIINKNVTQNLKKQLLRFNDDGARDYTFGIKGVLTDSKPSSFLSFALNRNRLYVMGTTNETLNDFPKLIVNAYDFYYNLITGVTNNELKTSEVIPGADALHFYPNPVKDKLVVTGLHTGATTYLQLTDGDGRIVQKATTQSSTFQWNVHSLSPGAYYLSITTSKVLPVTYKVIKE